MKVLYASDLHGEPRLYQELFALAASSSADLLAMGGDLFPSFPPTQRYEDMVPNQKTFIDQLLIPFFERIMKTTAIRQILLIPGNWDLGYFHLFREPMEGVVDVSQKPFHLKNGYEIIGYPFVPPTPFRPKDFEKMDDRDAPWPPQKNPSYIRSPDQTDQLIPIDPHLYLRQRETMEDDLGRLPKSKDSRKTIYLMHSPPFETKLDQIVGRRFTGSRAIRRFIEETEPLLTLHGHIHEAPEVSGSYLDRIGKTLCVNPGQSIGKTILRLHAVLFEMERIEETVRHTCLPRDEAVLGSPKIIH